jgi:DNA-binding NarL/FixJ family response regulator
VFSLFLTIVDNSQVKFQFFLSGSTPKSNMMAFEKIIQVAIADDHKIFRDGIRMSLKNRDYIKILWEADDGKDMMHKLKIKNPDILLMDIRIPELNGTSALQLIRRENEDIKIIILSMYDDKETITKMMEFGANAYLSKTSDADEIYKAILCCMNEDFYFNDLVNSAVLLKLQHKKRIKKFYPSAVNFNDKEMKILRLIAEDKTTEEISEDVFLSPRTVETIRQNMKAKVGAKTIAGLMMYAMRNKLVE